MELPDGLPLIAWMEGLCARWTGRAIGPLALSARGGLESASSALFSCAGTGGRVGIVTGAFIPDGQPPAAETDGPVGAAALASALVLLGATPVLITDEPCAGAVQACADACGERFTTHVFPVDSPEDRIEGWLEEAHLDHLVAIERIGPSADGNAYGMGGTNFSPYMAPLHALFSGSVQSTGIGDGGNEIGMGAIPHDIVARFMPNGEKTHCTVSTDNLIVAGTSNWGSYELVAALALRALSHQSVELQRRMAEILSPRRDRCLLDATLRAGAIDGALRRPASSVDGVAPEHYEDLLLSLQGAITGGMHLPVGAEP